MNSKQPLLTQVIIWQSQYRQKPSADHIAMCHRMELCARSVGINKYTDPPWVGVMRGEGRDSQGRERLEWFSFKIILFIFGCAGSLLLRELFSGCSQRGLLSSGLQASHGGAFSCCGAQALGHVGFSSSAHGLSHFGSQAPQHGLVLWHTGFIALRHVGSFQIRD